MTSTVPAEGGFGSAGAGNRSMRRTMTRAGTASGVQLAALKDSRVRPATLAEPTAEQLRPTIKGQVCWWCDDDRIFVALSGHWVAAHGIDLQWVRDLLGVRKKTPFISPELSRQFAERSRRLHDPEKLSYRGGPKELSAYGLAAQAKRHDTYRERIGEKEYRRRLLKMAQRPRVRPEFCTVEGCDRPHAARDLCAKHYQIARATATWVKRCTVEGCEGPHRAKGFCNTHYLHDRKRWREADSLRCAVADCDAARHSRGVCRPHYRQLETREQA